MCALGQYYVQFRTILCHTNHIPEPFGKDKQRQSPHHTWASSHSSTHTKTFCPFHYLASTMIRLNPRLVHLRAFGTDGESELIKAFHTCFPHAVHLRCVNHLRQNIKEKLHDLKIPQNVWKEFLSDIFGVQVGTHFECGLLDSRSESDFSAQLSTLRERWNNLERSCKESTSPPEFHTWFLTYKARDFIECALPEVHTKAGINPLQHFTTNTSESLNHIIKLEVE